MKLGYIHDAPMPAIEANTVNVAKMCDAFVANGHQPLLVHLTTKSEASLSTYYGLAHEIVGRAVPRFIARRARALALAAALHFRLKGAKLVYGRKPQLLLASARLGLPVVYEAHYALTDAHPRSKAALRKLIASGRLARVVAISSALRDDIAAQWPEIAHRIVVAHDGADALPADRRTSVKPGLNFSKPVIGYAGHLYPGKGMETIAELSLARPDLDFLVIGGKPADLAAWREKTHGQPNLHFVGMVPHHEVPSYLAACRVVLAPYAAVVRVSDGTSDVGRWMSPLKIFEYMAQGLPIVATDLPVLREILEHGRTALLCPPQDIPSWSDALDTLLGDAEATARIGEAAREELETRYTWRERARAVLADLELA